MDVLHLDFETRSTVDLKTRGLHVYAQHPSTEILCMGFAFNDEPVQVWSTTSWDVRHDQTVRLFEHVQSLGIVYAHNAPFELEIWNQIGVHRYGWPVLKPEQTFCTMALSYAMSLPGALEKASGAMGISHQKDMKGHRVMLQLSQPRVFQEDGTPVWWDNPEKYEILYNYCRQDVEVERELYKRVFKLCEKERKLWLLDYKINQRGIQIDVPSVKKAICLVDLEKKKLNDEMCEVTKGDVSACTEVAKLTAWLHSQQVELSGVAKADVIELLKKENLSSHCKRALTLRQEAAKSSTSKLQGMIDRAGSDGRARGNFQYHGAATGRWAGRGPIQLHNLPRPRLSQKEIDSVFHILETCPPEIGLETIRLLFGPPLQSLSDCIRGFLVARDGCQLMAGDFSNIEGRVLAWLANEVWKLAAYIEFDQGVGPDLYNLMAQMIYNINDVRDVTKEERLIGKVGELSLGYQGGANAFKSMARNFNVEISDTLADSIKTRWRENNRNIVKFWYGLEYAAVSATLNPHSPYSVGDKITYKKAGSFLWCQLPSQRVLCYPYPKIESKLMPWGDTKDVLTYMAENSLTRKWERHSLYGGLLCENVTQAVARDLLAEAMFRCEERKYPIVMHIHDEIVCEMQEGLGNISELESIMRELPSWCQGLPISVQGWVGKRYRK